MSHEDIDRSIIRLLQDDLPLETHPFQNLAQELGISQEEIIVRMRDLQKRGTIRRWGAVLRHQQAGFIVNAMVAWKIEIGQADEIGKFVAEFKEVSHCYLRQVPETFAYNLFAMIHARSYERLYEIIHKISARPGLDNYIIIKSLKEFKKASMKYV